MSNYNIFTINPGSTSTKIGLFEGETALFVENVSHDAEKLKEFANISDQLSYRRDTINELLEKRNIKLNDVDAFVGRGGGLMAVEGISQTIWSLYIPETSGNIYLLILHPPSF